MAGTGCVQGTDLETIVAWRNSRITPIAIGRPVGRLRIQTEQLGAVADAVLVAEGQQARGEVDLTMLGRNSRAVRKPLAAGFYP